MQEKGKLSLEKNGNAVLEPSPKFLLKLEGMQSSYVSVLVIEMFRKKDGIRPVAISCLCTSDS